LPVASRAALAPELNPKAAATVAVQPAAQLLDTSLPAVPAQSVAVSPGAVARPVVSAGTGWSTEDERLQQEAIRTIHLLRHRAETVQDSNITGRVKEGEWSWKEAAKQQVMCLEYELDGKEAALQLAEKHLEQREAELLEVQQQLELLRAGDAAAEDAARIRSLRNELEEKERQLELKDTHIQQLLAILNQHGTSLVGGEPERTNGCGFGVGYPTTHFR